MKLLAYNILEGGLGRIDPLAEVIRQSDPDLVIAPEASDETEFAKLASRLGMDYFRAQNPRDPLGAVGLLVKPPYEIREAANLTALEPRFTRAVLQATITFPPNSSTPAFHLLGVHFHARETLADEAIRLAELAALLAFAQPLYDARLPFALAGDFNAHHPDQPIDLAKTRPSTLARIAPQNNVIPRDVIRTLLASHGGYLDTHTLTRAPAQFQTTLTTAHPTMRPDYIIVPAYLRTAVHRCDVIMGGPGAAGTLPKFASDHFPILADLSL